MLTRTKEREKETRFAEGGGGEVLILWLRKPEGVRGNAPSPFRGEEKK